MAYVKYFLIKIRRYGKSGFPRLRKPALTKGMRKAFYRFLKYTFCKNTEQQKNHSTCAIGTTTSVSAS